MGCKRKTTSHVLKVGHFFQRLEKKDSLEQLGVINFSVLDEMVANHTLMSIPAVL